MQKIKNTFSLLRGNFTALWLIFVFVAVFTVLSFGRHDALKSYLNDLGTYDQAIWNTLHGRFFELSASMIDEKNYWGAHFSPMLLFFVPFYFFLATPKWLLFFQALAVGLSALPIYWLAKEKLKSQGAGLVFLVSYFFYPVLHNGLLYDFHEVVLATVFASFAFYFLEKGNLKGFIVAAVLLAFSQEHMALLVLMMGLYAVVFKRKYSFGLLVSVIAGAYFFLTLTVWMPFFSSTKGLSLLVSDARYAWLGGNPKEIVLNIFSHPMKVAEVIFSFERLKYLFLLFIPVFALGIFSWAILIIVPIVLIYLLSQNGMMHNISFYHSAILAPFIFFSAILALRHFFGDNEKLKKMFLGCVLVTSIGSGILFGLSPLSLRYSADDYLPTEHAKKISEVKKKIPTSASLSVQHNLGSQFSEREKLYRFPLGLEKAEFVLVDETDVYAKNPNQIFGFEYALQLPINEWKGTIAGLKKSPDFSLIYSQDGYLLFQRK
jgi:uncharacterized membrane protein